MSVVNGEISKNMVLSSSELNKAGWTAPTYYLITVEVPSARFGELGDGSSQMSDSVQMLLGVIVIKFGLHLTSTVIYYEK